VSRLMEAIGNLQKCAKAEGGSITEFYTKIIHPLIESSYNAKVDDPCARKKMHMP